jgi:hypothetical protein
MTIAAPRSRRRAIRAEPPPKLLFLGGYARSGSTILDRAIGAGDGFVSLGEIRFIWKRGFQEDQLCGCGEPFSACPFWREVVRTAWGTLTQGEVEEIVRLQDRVDRWWRIPQLGFGGFGVCRDLRAYGNVLGRLYAAVRSIRGARVLVDSSKDASHGWVLLSSGAPVDLRVLHLVRDSRAVAYSLCERKRFDPGSGTTWSSHGLARTIGGWTATNALVGSMRTLTRVPYMRMSYEAFCAEPDRSLADIAAFVGEEPPPPLDPGGIRPGIQHQVAGNPVRFERGPIAIRTDDEWRGSMSPVRRRAVTVATWPMLRADRS